MANQSNGHNDNVQLKYQWVFYRSGQFVFQKEDAAPRI